MWLAGRTRRFAPTDGDLFNHEGEFRLKSEGAVELSVDYWGARGYKESGLAGKRR
jgi:hypothetical protein